MTEFILRVIAAGGYWGFALLMALENVFPPIPTEVIMGFGGIAAARGDFGLVPLVLIGTAGATIGNSFWYVLGRRLGYARLKPLVDRWGRWLTVEWEDVEYLLRAFRAKGGRIVFVFRFLPTFRTIISLPAGMAGMGFFRFAAFTFAGSGIWNAGWAIAGYILHQRFRALQDYAGWFGLALVAGGALLYLYRVATWRPRAVRR